MLNDFTQIKIESHFDGKLLIAKLNQPESYNSFTKIMLSELRTFVKEAPKNPNVRCLAISGEGKAFSAGQNLKEALKAMDTEPNMIQRIVVEYYNPMVVEIAKSKLPVIALVNGVAVGAGANLALVCDFALSTESAVFSQAFVNIGLIPDTAGTYYLPKNLSRQMMSYLAFTGKKFTAKEAKEIGFIADYFPDAEFQEKAMEILAQICELPTVAIGLTKKAFRKAYNNSLEQQLDLEGILQQDAAETQDFVEGVQAFLEKRKPEYKGK